MSNENFHLDVANFEEVAEYCTRIADSMREFKQDLDNSKNALRSVWTGKGGSEFDKKFYVVAQRLGDLKDQLYEIGESVKDATDSYIQADIDFAKTLDGSDTPKYK